MDAGSANDLDRGFTTIGRIIASETCSREDVSAKSQEKESSGRATKLSDKWQGKAIGEKSEDKDMETKYLVKWQGLTYDEASWEWERDLRSFAASDLDAALAKFNTRGPIANDAAIKSSQVALAAKSIALIPCRSWQHDWNCAAF